MFCNVTSQPLCKVSYAIDNCNKVVTFVEVSGKQLSH